MLIDNQKQVLKRLQDGDPLVVTPLGTRVGQQPIDNDTYLWITSQELVDPPTVMSMTHLMGYVSPKGKTIKI